jgi:hypothetical protein
VKDGPIHPDRSQHLHGFAGDTSSDSSVACGKIDRRFCGLLCEKHRGRPLFSSTHGNACYPDSSVGFLQGHFHHHPKAGDWSYMRPDIVANGSRFGSFATAIFAAIMLNAAASHASIRRRHTLHYFPI